MSVVFFCVVFFQRSEIRLSLGKGNSKNISNQHRRTEMTKYKNDVITWKSELEIQYNVARIRNAHNEVHSKLYQSTKDNINTKAEIKKKNEKKI